MTRHLFAALTVFTLLASAAHAEEKVLLEVKSQRFVPDTLTLPADQKIRLLIKNHNPTPIEFESTDLNREKIIPANGEATIIIGPLSSGTYSFFDDFHHDETTGKIIVR